MAEQSSIQLGDIVRGKHTQDNRFFKVNEITRWPYTGERLLRGYVKANTLHSEFEANVEVVLRSNPCHP